MVIGSAELELLLPSCLSLKDKRQILKSLLERLRHRFNLAAAEVGGQEQWQRAVIGVACVSNDPEHVREILAQIMRFIECDGRCEIARASVELC
ncbi:MAG: DUF503 domain-containing protein [Bacteroidota bacterium]